MSEKYKSKNINNTIKDIDTDNIHVRDIRNLINSDSITTDELIKESKVLDKDILEKIKSYKDLDIDYNDWKDLPPLQKNRTDLYFFGQPGSGKTCILASLFYYAHQKGLIKDNQSNREGSKYRDTLINGVKKGILAEGTPTDGVNYIPLDLTNPTNKRIHPLNFIEMSGEKFVNAYKKGIKKDNIGANKYLKNNNRKLLFFVLDYLSFIKDEKSILSQDSMLQNVLTLLSNDNTLDKTDTIYLILSKSDMFPKGENQLDFAQEFVDMKLKNLKNNLKIIQKEHNNNFKIILFPYSLGEIKFRGLLTNFDVTSPKNLIDWICAYSFSEERNWWKKIIGIK
jgi:GTPase SAR1 family protein